MKFIIRPFFCKIIMSKLLCLDRKTYFQTKKIEFQKESFFAVWDTLQVRARSAVKQAFAPCMATRAPESEVLD